MSIFLVASECRNWDKTLDAKNVGLVYIVDVVEMTKLLSWEEIRKMVDLFALFLFWICLLKCVW